MRRTLILALCSASIGLTNNAQAASNAGAELRRLQDETRAGLRNNPIREPVAAPAQSGYSAQAAEASAERIWVQGYQVLGVSQFSAEELRPLLAPYSGRALSTGEIHQAANALMQHYRAAGFFAAKVFIPPQLSNVGVITLDVYEGLLDEPGLEVDNQGQHIDSAQVQAMLADRLSSERPLHRADVERVLLLIEDLPGVAVNATLYPGQAVGSARLRTEVRDEPTFSGNLDVDNFGSEHTGRERLGTTLYWNSPNGVGDQLATRLVTSGSGSQYAFLNYLLPVSPSGTRLGTSVDYYRYQTDNIDNLGDADGYASDWRLYATHPLIRSRHSNLNVRAELSHLRVVDDNDLNLDAVRHVDSLTLALEGDEDHDWLANGLTLYRLALTAGEVDLRGNQAFRRYDRLGPSSDGGFARLNVNLERLQHLYGAWSAHGRLSGQWASGNLDTSQKYYLGGPLSLAGYPPGEAGGDEAVELHAALRYDVPQAVLGGQLQGEVFFQKAWLRNHIDPWQSWQGNNPDLDNEVTLDGMGVGLTQTWQDTWLLRGLVGWQTATSPVQDPVTGENTDGIDDDYRVWVQLVRYF